MFWVEENILFATTALIVVKILESFPLPFWCFTSKFFLSFGLLNRRSYLLFFSCSVCDSTFHNIVGSWRLMLLIILSWCSSSGLVIYLWIDSLNWDNRMGFMRIIIIHVVVVLRLRILGILGHMMLTGLGSIWLIGNRNCTNFFALSSWCLKSIIFANISFRHMLLFCS